MKLTAQEIIIETTARHFDLLNEYGYTKEQCRMLLNEVKDKLLLLEFKQQSQLLVFEEWCKENVKVSEYKEAINDILERYKRTNT